MSAFKVLEDTVSDVIKFTVLFSDDEYGWTCTHTKVPTITLDSIFQICVNHTDPTNGILHWMIVSSIMDMQWDSSQKEQDSSAVDQGMSAHVVMRNQSHIQGRARAVVQLTVDDNVLYRTTAILSNLISIYLKEEC
ncbi:hypothetical protein Tco_1120953 [Tanacetum coccineum]|uniref:Uncharacterized protein n=1 Tax=Tanacetum coccineum TaxID=301880 RepID=A0ABQ5IWC2_9ASTR